MQKRNILVLVEFFNQGGAEKVAAMLAQMLAENGRYNVFLFSVHKTAVPFSFDGITTGSLNIDAVTGITQKIVNYYNKILRLERVKRKLKIDLTISSLWPVDWMNAITGNDKKIGIIQINILNNEQNAKMVRHKQLVRTIYSRFDKVVMSGPNLVQELTQFFKIRKELLAVIQNPIDTRLIDKNRQLPVTEKLAGLLANYKVCVAANRLHATKNTEALVYIFNKLSNKEGIKLLIIGEGEEKEKLQQTITKEGLTYSQVEDESFDENVTIYFLNFQVNMHNIISRSKLFLFPTKSEGLPLALLEAMYCGVPVIVSDCASGGVSDIMQGKQPYNPATPRETSEWTGFGYLMPIPEKRKKESLEIWKERIEELLDDDAGEFNNVKESGRQRAKTFDKEKIKLEWFTLIEELLDDNKKNRGKE